VITVVSGHRRSGTSMMMQALHEGGLPALYTPALENANPDTNGFQPNPGGLYEVGFLSYTVPKFLRLMPDGCAVKIMWDGIVNLPKGDWKIIFMERSQKEIESSIAILEKHLIENNIASAYNHPLTRGMPFCCFRTYNRDNIDHVLGIMDTRRDVELLSVQYQDVINSPIKVFQQLKYTDSGEERLPIDVDKAAAVINTDLHRVRA
jgi:hypothetical protein